MSDLHELKQEADELGVTYAKNITAEKLAEKIDEFYQSQETSTVKVDETGQEEETVPESIDAPDNEPKMTKAELRQKKRKEREAKARATRIVTILDNDQRVNNHTSTCSANCSNEFFDLGTKIFPLNEKIEISVGHIKALQSVQIPMHVTDSKSGMSTVRMRPRYSISFEDNSI